MEALDPPTPKNIRRAVDSLIEVKALTTDEELTVLGRQLAKLPLDVYLGKLILLSSIFKCTDAGLTVAAILSSKSPFSAPMGARSKADQARLAFKKGDSDLLTVYNAYCSWRRVCKTNGSSEYQFCRKNFLVPQTLANIEDLKSQLASVLVEAGFVKLEGESRLLHRYDIKLRNKQNKSDFSTQRPLLHPPKELRRAPQLKQHQRRQRPNPQLSHSLELLPQASLQRRSGVEERLQQPERHSSSGLCQQGSARPTSLALILSHHAIQLQVRSPLLSTPSKVTRY